MRHATLILLSMIITLWVTAVPWRAHFNNVGGCSLEGTPSPLVVLTGSPDCDQPTSNCPPNEGQCAYFSGNGVVATQSIPHTDRYCVDIGYIKAVAGGRADHYDPILAARQGLSWIYPQVNVQNSSPLEVQMACSSSEVSPSILDGIRTDSWRRLTLDFVQSAGKGCLTSFDPADYQGTGESVCCDASSAPPDWTAFALGDMALGFSIDTRVDEWRIYSKPCDQPVLREAFTAHPTGQNSGSIDLQIPPGTQLGDLLIAVVGQESSTDCTLSSGTWSALQSTSNGSGLRGSSRAFWKIASSTEVGAATALFSSTCSSKEWVGTMYRFATMTFADIPMDAWKVSLPTYVETAPDVNQATCQEVTGLPDNAIVLRVGFWETSSSQNPGLKWIGLEEDVETSTTAGGAATAALHAGIQAPVNGTAPSVTTDVIGSGNFDSHCWTIPILPPD